MALPTTFKPLLTRIEEVLGERQGSARTIPEGYEFGTGFHPLMDEEEAAHLVQSQSTDRGMWVTIPTMLPTDSPNPASEIMRLAIVVRIDLFYYMGTKWNEQNWLDTQAEAADDVRRIASALEESGNLEQTESGDETGLASEMLVFDQNAGGWNLEDPDPDSDLLRASIFFTGVIELQKPS